MNQFRIRVFLLMLADLGCFAGVLLAVLYGYQLLGGDYELERYFTLWPVLPIFIAANGFLRLYHGNILYPGSSIGPIEEIRRSFFAIVLTYLLLFSYLSLTHGMLAYSRLALLLSLILSFLLLPVFRWMVRSLMKSAGVGLCDVLIAGAGIAGREVAHELDRDRFFGFRPVAFVDDHIKQIDGEHVLPVVGTLAQGVHYARKHGVDYVICCLPIVALKNTLERYSSYFKHIMVIPDNQSSSIAWAYPINLNGFSAIEFRNQLLLPAPRVFKGVIELFLSFFGVLFLLPLFLILSLIVKFSSRGPVFYSAKRLGLHGKVIHVWKFRTMYQDADLRLESLLEEDPVLKKEWLANFKLQADPRITPVGRFLRKTSLDELPQLWNVVRGDMAMIGPRPIVSAEIEKYGNDYQFLKRVKPGITGLWQVSGRSDLDYCKRINLDRHYIMNWTVWMDYYIFLKTIKEIITARGAR